MYTCVHRYTHEVREQPPFLFSFFVRQHLSLTWILALPATGWLLSMSQGPMFLLLPSSKVVWEALLSMCCFY